MLQCYLAKLSGKWTQGETEQHEIIWTENKQSVVSLASFRRGSYGIKHSEHQEWLFLGGTGPVGVSVQGKCGCWYLMADTGWANPWGQPVAIQPEAQIYLACGYMKLLFIPWLLLLLPSFNLSSLFPPGSVAPGRDREWSGEPSLE